MARQTFSCIDAHTCGNPLRLVTSAVPNLNGATMSEKRQDFIEHHDWIRRALMFEPRGHAQMSGAILYPPISAEADAAILYIETTGCLPMCGHGTMGAITAGIEHGLLKPRTPGRLVLDAPAGLLTIDYEEQDGRVISVKITNVPSFLAIEGVEVDCPGLGPLIMDVAYGGNFYAIIEPQENYSGLDSLKAADILRFSPQIREILAETVTPVHPEDPSIKGIRHVMWTGEPSDGADAKNAVFYGEQAIDRSPCGTGTSARMAQLYARGELKPGGTFIHESIIGSCFTGRIEGITKVGGHEAIIPSIEGWAKVTGFNTIFVDDDDPFAHGFWVG